MSLLATPCTPNRRPAHSPPRTPCRRRALHTPLTEEDPELITPITPSPVRLFRGKEELEFKHRVARRLFFTPQQGTQAYIPPSPPLTPTTFLGRAVSRVEDDSVSPVKMHHHGHYIPRSHHQHPYQRPHSPATPQVVPAHQVPLELGSPIICRRTMNKAKVTSH